MPTVLIVDDNDLIRSGLRRILSATPEWRVCGEAESGLRAVQLAEELKPDVIIMDFSMPGIDGLEASQDIKAILPNTKILLLTVYISKELAEIAFRAGANGYIVKGSTRHELIHSLGVIYRGGIYVSPAIVSAMPRHFTDASQG